jgi:hypothetical protein
MATLSRRICDCCNRRGCRGAATAQTTGANSDARNDCRRSVVTAVRSVVETLSVEPSSILPVGMRPILCISPTWTGPLHPHAIHTPLQRQPAGTQKRRRASVQAARTHAEQPVQRRAARCPRISRRYCFGKKRIPTCWKRLSRRANARTKQWRDRRAVDVCQSAQCVTAIVTSRHCAAEDCRSCWRVRPLVRGLRLDLEFCG